MRIIDPHAHMSSRVTDDYERMALAGIEAVVEPAFWLGSPRTSAGSFRDYFELILGWERERARRYGIAHFCCLSLNPREANDPALQREVLPLVAQYCQRDGCVGIGEIGFDRQSDAEEAAFRAQLRLAREHRLPVIVHLPHQHKLAGTQRTLEVLADERMNPGLVVLDHHTEETMPLVAGTPYWHGLTVYYVTKLTAERAANIVAQYGMERVLINSSCDWGYSDPLAVPRVALELQRRGMARERIAQLVFANPLAFFGQSPRWTFQAQAGAARPTGAWAVPVRAG